MNNNTEEVDEPESGTSISILLFRVHIFTYSKGRKKTLFKRNLVTVVVCVGLGKELLTLFKSVYVGRAYQKMPGKILQ